MEIKGQTLGNYASLALFLHLKNQLQFKCIIQTLSIINIEELRIRAEDIRALLIGCMHNIVAKTAV